MANRTISAAGIALIKRFEGCRLTAYKCSAGVWTIGYGHTSGVHSGQAITQAQADALLRQDLEKFERYVNSTAYVPITAQLNENQFAALVSFAFNCGQGNLKRLCAGRNTVQIAAAMPQYCKASGRKLPGLVQRRAAEVALFNTPVNTASVQTSTTQQYTHKVGEVVTYSTCYNSSDDSNSKVISCSPWRFGTITKIKAGAKNPYLIENGRCWVNDGDIRSTGSVQQTSQNTSSVYVVKKGDTLTKIAKSHGTTVDAIKKLNGVKNVNKIVVGQKIRLK